MKILVQHATIIELGRILTLNLKSLGKTKYSAQVERIFKDFNQNYQVEISENSLDCLKSFKKNLLILENVKKSDRIDEEVETLIDRIDQELERIIETQIQNLEN